MVGRNGTHRYSLTVRSRLFVREVTIGPANLLSGSSCGLYWRRAFCPSPSYIPIRDSVHAEQALKLTNILRFCTTICKSARSTRLSESDEFGLSGSQSLRLQQQIVHVSITAAASEQSFDVAVDGSTTPIGTSSGDSSKYPRDDPATFGLVSPSVSAAASATGRSISADNATWLLRSCNPTSARGSPLVGRL